MKRLPRTARALQLGSLQGERKGPWGCQDKPARHPTSMLGRASPGQPRFLGERNSATETLIWPLSLSKQWLIKLHCNSKLLLQPEITQIYLASKHGLTFRIPRCRIRLRSLCPFPRPSVPVEIFLAQWLVGAAVAFLQRGPAVVPVREALVAVEGGLHLDPSTSLRCN